ncbi:hypothetical protein [Clostridium sp.]|jgi:stage V sporulation protein AF|uniref:hypothetical protein n=1 Tax=Clostridium sp. TaxID=1506 RepID=UPI0039F49D23
MTYISNKLDENKKLLKSRLPIDKSFDMIGREIKIGDREAFFCYARWLCKR